MSERPGKFGAFAGNNLCQRFGRVRRQHSRCFGPAQHQSSSPPRYRSGSTGLEPDILFHRPKAARPTTAQEDSDEPQAGKGGKADAKAPDVPVEILLAGSLGTGCILRPGTPSGAEKRLMTAGPDPVTDTP